MAQGYFTLKEAAKMLAMPEDELKQMAQKGKVRSFQDRGTLRFRAQDVEEMARARGVSSEPELALGDASLPKPKSTPSSASKKKAAPSSGSKKKAPASGPKTPNKQEAAPDVFDFDFDDSVDLGADAPPKSGAKGKPISKGTKKAATPPKGSDSDVRLVADGNDVSFTVPKPGAKPPDSDVKVPSDPLKPKTNVHSGAPASVGKLAVDSDARLLSKPGGSSGSRQASPRPTISPQPDSGVRLVPMDSDSDVKLVGASDEVALGGSGPSAASDSNVRLEKIELPPADSGEGGMLLTEEINLDEEIAKHKEKEKDQPSTKLKAKSQLKLPEASPFELSDSDLDLPSELREDAGPKTPKAAEASQNDSSDFNLAARPGRDHDTSSEFDLGAPSKNEGSSDFDLVPAADGSILLEGESNDFSLEASDDDDSVLQDESAALTRGSSGLNLDRPVDAGISLEEVADESGDFDLSLEPEATPKPQTSQPAEESSEFELTAGEKTPRPKKKKPSTGESSDDIDLSLEADSVADVPAQKDDSEFEINLDGSDEGKAIGSESDSEFELTLDDSGNLSAMENADAAPQVKSKTGAAAEEQDIFDTDFEVPALDESDEAAVADSELESSDFDIALDDSDLASEEESGSQVVALDEEEQAEAASDEDGAVADDVEVEEESSDFSDLDQDVEVAEGEDVEVEADAEARTVVKTKTIVKERLIQPAPWGVLPVVFMLPCVIVMFLVAILGYELVQTSTGARPPGPLTTALADMMGQDITLKKK